jgi:RNA-binding protein YlmH
MIREGLCFVNWIKTESPSQSIKIGDVITLRGKGRVTLSGIGGQSRKGKTFIELLK